MKKLLLAFILSLILMGCSDTEKDYMPVANFTDISKPVSYGNHQDIYVFSNQTLDENTLNIMKQQFGYPTEGAQKERTFQLIWKSFSDFEELKKAKNIMFVCNMDIPSSFTAFISSKIPQDKLDSVLQGASSILTYQNEWSDDQLVTFILSNNENSLDNIIVSRIANLYLDYEKRFLQRMTRRVYYRGTLKDNFFADYNYNVTLPSTFQIYKEIKEENMISFIYRYKKKATVLPDKYLTVYQENMDKDEVTESWFRKTRSKIGDTVLDGDEIDWLRTRLMPKTFTTWNNEKYLGYVLEGAWENTRTNMGGSFKSYAFFDDQTNAAYFIDTAVYYPAGTKIPYITELEGIAKSFNTKIKEQK